MPDWKIRRAPTITTEIEVPGDKSISHRAVILAAMANGPCVIRGFLPSEDCLRTVGAMRAARHRDRNRRPDHARRPWQAAHFHRAAERHRLRKLRHDMRLLAGLLAGQPFKSRLVGDESLSKRPMKRVIEPLAQMGATFAPKATAAGRRSPSRAEAQADALHQPRRQRAGEGRRIARGPVRQWPDQRHRTTKAAITPSACSNIFWSVRRRAT